MSTILYRLAIGISAICSGSTSIATMSRNTRVRPRHLPKTSEYAVRLEITVTRIVTGTVIAIEVVSEFSTPPALNPAENNGW